MMSSCLSRRVQEKRQTIFGGGETKCMKMKLDIIVERVVLKLHPTSINANHVFDLGDNKHFSLSVLIYSWKS